MDYSLLLFAILKSYLFLTIYQQAHYQFRSYAKHFLSNFLYYNLFPIFIVTVGFFSDDVFVWWLCGIYLLFCGSFYLFCRKPLKVTKRMARLIVLVVAVLIGYFFIPFAAPLFLLFSEYAVFPVLLLEKGISYMCNRPYIRKAEEKYSRFSGKRIAITGSFGKTSTKFLLHQALSCFDTVASTQKSYNTPLGISKFINETPLDAYQTVILEYGASKKDDIAYLCRTFPADVAFVTAIGYMHLDGFKTIEEVIREKMILPERLGDDGIAVLNYECEEIRNYRFQNKCTLVTYGFDYGDYQARNIEIGSVSKFDFYYLEEKLATVVVRLVGKHQLLNLTGVLAYCHHCGLDLLKIVRAAYGFHVEKNRLERKQYHRQLVLDDSFNSNLKGFKEALYILKESPGTHILLTPGMVELGKYVRILSEQLIEDIVSACDIVILVGYANTRVFYQRLKEYALEVYVVRNFKEGYRLYQTMIKTKDLTTLLIENDLPDLYRVGWTI